MVEDPSTFTYTLKVHEVNHEASTVTLLFEEVEGRDGFTVMLTMEEFEELTSSSEALQKWIHEKIQERIQLLKQAYQHMKTQEEMKTKLQSKLEKTLQNTTLKTTPP